MIQIKIKELYICMILVSLFSLLLEEYLSVENLKLLDAFDKKKKASTSTTTSNTASSMSPLMSSLVSSCQVIPSVDSLETFEAKKRLSDKNKAIMKMSLFMEGIGTFAMVRLH